MVQDGGESRLTRNSASDNTTRILFQKERTEQTSCPVYHITNGESYPAFQKILIYSTFHAETDGLHSSKTNKTTCSLISFC